MADRPSHALCDHNMNTIAAQLDLTEVRADDGGPAMTLTSEMSPDPVGELRRWERDGVATMVYVGIVVPMIGLDSHMIYAFTPAESPVPHFTLDSVQTKLPPEAGGGDVLAFHLDLNPRLDPGVNPRYLEHVYVPLSDARARGLAIDGVTPADLQPLQWQVMSSWMMANRATPEAFEEVGDIVAEYRNHWFGLVEAGVPDSVTNDWDGARIAQRDAESRDTIFSTEVDPVWDIIARLLGQDQATTLRESVRDAGRENG
ncbi:MAG: hypothetical protein GY812_08965 [Actinomycetia bacterium]|nr:hypothetical protein [Actinomycetes bacterium]